MTRVLIADDDDHLMRAGLIELLTADPGIEIVGQAATGREAVPSSRPAGWPPTSCSWTYGCPMWTASPPPGSSRGRRRR